MKRKNRVIVALILSLVFCFVFGNVALASEHKLVLNEQVYCVGDVNTSVEFIQAIEFPNGEKGYISVEYEPQTNARANGDPVVAGIYTVSAWTPMTTIEYKVNTSTEGKITRAYDVYFGTVHEVLEYDLYWTDYRANLDATVKFLSIAGTFRFYVDFYIEDGRVYTETNLF